MISAQAKQSRANALKKSRYQIKPGGVVEYSDEWFTPPEIVKALGEFDLDPSAGPMNHARLNLRASEGQNGLSQEWSGRVWLNPPYSTLPEWLEKMQAHANGICLVTARTETQWFQAVAKTCSALFFYKGRMKFLRPDGTKNNIPCGSVLVAWGGANVEALRNSGLPGVLALIES